MNANGSSLQKHGYLMDLHLVCQTKIKSLLKVLILFSLCDLEIWQWSRAFLDHGKTSCHITLELGYEHGMEQKRNLSHK